MPGVDSSSAASASASAYPHASDQTIVGYILIALIIFAAMALIFRSLFKLVKTARRLDKADLKSAAAVAASEGEVSTSSTSAGAGVGNHNTQRLKDRLKSAIPRRWDDIDDKLDEFERLTVKYYGNAKRYAVRTLQNMGVLEKAADEEGGIAPDSHPKSKWRLTAGYFNKTASDPSQNQHQHQQQQPEDPANTTTDSDQELDLEDTSISIVKLPSLDLSTAPTLPYQPHPSTTPTPTHKEVRRITAIDILEALAKVGRLSLSLSSYTNSTYAEKMDSLLPRVSRDSKTSSLTRGNTMKVNKEWRRLTALDYLSKLVTSATPDSVDRNKPLPHRPISVVGSVHGVSVSVEDVIIGPPPPLALAVISEEDLEGGEGGACVSDGQGAEDEDQGKQVDSESEKDAALPLPAPSKHRRSMTLPIQQAQPHLTLASGLSPSSSLKAALQDQAEKDEQVLSESDENTTTTEEDSELRPTSDIPHITALAEIAASIVGDHPDAPPILERVASLNLTTPSPSPSVLPLPYSLPLSVLSLDPTPTPLQNYNQAAAATSKFAWAGNTHRTTFGLITRTNVPPTPPRLAMFVGSSGDGGDVGFRSNAGSVVGVGGKKSLGADTGIVLVQTTSLDLGRGVRGSVSANEGGGANGNVDANRNSQAPVNANANANASTNSNAAASPTGNLLPLANTNANATTSPDANINSAVTEPELLEKIKEAVSERQNEGHLGKGGQLGSEGQVEEDQLRKEGQVEQQEGLLAKDGPVEKEEQVSTGHVAGNLTATGGTIGKTSTPAQAETTTTTATEKLSAFRPPAPTRPPTSVQINSRQSTPARLAVPLRPTRGKENRYVAGEPPRSVRRPPSQLRNVLCAI